VTASLPARSRSGRGTASLKTSDFPLECRVFVHFVCFNDNTDTLR